MSALIRAKIEPVHELHTHGNSMKSLHPHRVAVEGHLTTRDNGVVQFMK